MFGAKPRHYIEYESREPPLPVRSFMNPQIRNFLMQLEDRARIHDARETEHSRKLLSLEPQTAELISIFARSSRARRILEIGTSGGYSTIWLAASVGSEGGRVISIDRNPEKHKLAQENLLAAGVLQFVDLRLGDATQVIKTLAGPFDFVFFDGDRTSAPGQLALLLSELAPQALVLADNALSHPQEIAGYLAMVTTLTQFQHVLIPVGKGLSVAFADARPNFQVP
jgi:predicted O-methyltransferase YrrM